ncbi:MAG: hypothetical protein ACRECM_07740 [Methyloceanibacter sp.]|jgi:hypothetical protein
MDYLVEAKRFIQHAQGALNPEVIRTDLEMAEWLLSRAIEEQNKGKAKLANDPVHQLDR